MDLKLKDLKLFLINGSGVESCYADIYNETYKTWKLVWSQAFKELDGVTRIHSDGFTRHNRIAAIFKDNTCIALIAVRECDISLPANKEDSLLSAWNDECYSKLIKYGTRVGICTYLSVHPDYRGEVSSEIYLKNIVMGLGVRILLHSDCDVLTGTMRCNRGTDKSAYNSGATLLGKSEMHGLEVDCVAFYKKELQADFNRIKNIWIDTLWNNHIDLNKITYRDIKKDQTLAFA